MRKKLIALLLAAALVCCCFQALADGPLTEGEIRDFWSDLLDVALSGERVEPEEYEDGLWCHDYETVLLYTVDETLTEDSPIALSTLSGGAEVISDMRGLTVGSDLWEVLNAYPLANPTLSGAYEAAALYVDGALPGAVHTGSLMRNGAHVDLIEHSLYLPDGEEATHYYISYVLENNRVVSIDAGVSRRDIAEVRQEIAELTALAEQRTYAPYTAEEPEPLAREDLLFTGANGALDFISATDGDLIALLGGPEADNREEADGASLRVMEWPGVTARLRDGADGLPPVLEELTVYGEALEGPRGLRMDDDSASVLARFPQNGDGTLYGDGENAPFGRMGYSDQGMFICYAAQAGEKTVLLTLDFVDDALWVITCAYQPD